MTSDQIKDIFSHHPPHGDQATRFQAIRSAALELALLINEVCPESREKSLAITNVQMASMMANSSIAIHEKPSPVPVPKPKVSRKARRSVAK